MCDILTMHHASSIMHRLVAFVYFLCLRQQRFKFQQISARDQISTHPILSFFLLYYKLKLKPSYHLLFPHAKPASLTSDLDVC